MRGQRPAFMLSTFYLADLDQEVTMQRRSRPAGGKDGLLLDAAQTGGGSMVEMTNGRISGCTRSRVRIIDNE